MKTTHTYTDQEAFDRAVRHALKQGKRSVIIELRSSGEIVEHCAYRGEDGMMCPVGALIPDEEYDKTMERKSAAKLVTKGTPSLQGLNPNLLCYVQFTHDTYAPREWEEEFRSVAKRYGLTFPTMEED